MISPSEFWRKKKLGCYIIICEKKGTFIVPSVGYLYTAVCSPCLKSWSSIPKKRVHIIWAKKRLILISKMWCKKLIHKFFFKCFSGSLYIYLFRYLFTFSQMPLFGFWEWTHQWYHKVKIYPKNAQSHLTWPFFIIVILGLLKSYVTCKRYTENIISTQNWVGKIDDSVCVMSNTMGFSKG